MTTAWCCFGKRCDTCYEHIWLVVAILGYSGIYNGIYNGIYGIIYIYILYLVGGLEPFYFFHSVGNNDPN